MKGEKHLNLYGSSSLKNLAQCSESLQAILFEHSKYYNSSVVCGHRGEVAQDDAYDSGVSKLQWPDSEHNSIPSNAFDIYPWSTTYGSLTTDPACVDRIARMAGLAYTSQATAYVTQQYYMQAQSIMICAKILGFKVRWGGDWDGDLDTLDQTFHDLGHFELIRE